VPSPCCPSLPLSIVGADARSNLKMRRAFAKSFQYDTRAVVVVAPLVLLVVLSALTVVFTFLVWKVSGEKYPNSFAEIRVRIVAVTLLTNISRAFLISRWRANILIIILFRISLAVCLRHSLKCED